MGILRSILAIVAGFVTMVIVVMVFTIVSVKALHLQSGHPTPLYLTLNVAYSVFAAMAGGYVSARIAMHHPLHHAYFLAGLIELLSLVSYFHYHGSQPLWYQLMLCIVPPLFVIAGAVLSVKLLPVPAL
jgi:hypothetical protein